jgi:hypothetical protein
MIQPLVGNLAVATCKETLCNSMVDAIRDELAHIGLPEVKEGQDKDGSKHSPSSLRFIAFSRRSCNLGGV